jgi:hypothetical protein
MKGKLSLLSAAVLMALAGTSADAAQHKPTASSGPITPSRVHYKAPTGSTVLYDQAGSPSNGLLAQNFASSSAAYSSAAADDFVVTDASGWTVTSINLPGVYFNGSGNADSFDVNIYPDAGGVPGATPVCTYSGLPYTGNAGVNPAFGAVSIALSSPCALTQGTYWVAPAANMSFGAGGEFGWAGFAPTPTPGFNAQWENPGGGLSTPVSCTTWGDIGNCLGVATTSMIFQILGHVTGGGGGGISLTVGLAEDNGNPAQCGTSTSLSATAGDQINFCYTVTNNSSIALNYQTLASTDVTGNIFTNQPITIAPGAQYQYNRTVTAGTTESPTATWTAADQLPGYTAGSGGQNFVDISGSGTALSLGDDASANATMPFSFNFYGVTSNQVCINNNGFVEFATSTSCSGNYSNSSLPTTDFANPVIMPFWDDLYTGGNVYYTTLGATPNRQFIVEYDNKDTFASQGANPGFTFETILNEADGTIDFVYNTVTGIGTGAHDGGLSATVGLQYDSTLANQFSYDTASLSNGQTINWAASSPTSYTASATVTLNVGAPVAAISPTALTGSAAVGGTTTTTLNIGNTGDRDLIWTVDEAPSNMHMPKVPAVVVPFHSREETSRFRAPSSKKHQGAKKPFLSPMKPFGTGAVPAYGETFTSSGFNYNSLDATVPGTLNVITAMSNYYFAGTFADNDFSTEYGISYPGGNLDAIDTTTGATQTIGNTGFGTTATGIRWDSTSGTTYAMSYNSGAGNSCLYSIDLTSGTTQQIGCASGTLIIDIAIDPSGNMYGVDIIADTLVAIDKTSGAAQAIGSIGFNANYAEGMDFDAATGVLYFAGFDADTGISSMYTIDTSTGAASSLGTIGGGSGEEMDALAIAVASGPCATPADVPWLSENPTSGTTAAGGSDPVTVTFDATSLTAGSYTANVCVNTNDSTQRHVAVPVTFTVTGNDTIFQDGFDGTP